MALRTLRLLAAFCFVVCSLPAQALPVRMQFGGTITNTFGLAGVVAGDDWSFDVIFETESADLSPLASLGQYAYRSLSLRTGSQTLTPEISPFQALTINDNHESGAPGLFWNGIVLMGSLGNDFGAPAPQFFVQMAKLCFGLPCDPSFGTTALPQSGVEFVNAIDDLFASDQKLFDFTILARTDTGALRGIAQGTLASWRSVAVPEPGTLALFASSLAALLWLTRRRTKPAAVLAAVSFAACALPAQAIPVSVRFGGEIQAATGLNGIATGDLWSLDVLYDTDAPDLAPEAEQGVYPYMYSLRIGALTLVQDEARGPGLLLVRDNFQFPDLPGTFWNGLTLTGAIANDLGAPRPEFIMQVVQICGDPGCSPSFGSTALPGSGEAFVAAIDALLAGSANTTLLLSAPFSGGPPQGFAFGTLLSWESVAVSEPGGLALWGTGMAALVWLIRRRGVTEPSRDPRPKNGPCRSPAVS